MTNSVVFGMGDERSTRGRREVLALVAYTTALVSVHAGGRERLGDRPVDLHVRFGPALTPALRNGVHPDEPVPQLCTRMICRGKKGTRRGDVCISFFRCNPIFRTHARSLISVYLSKRRCARWWSFTSQTSQASPVLYCISLCGEALKAITHRYHVVRPPFTCIPAPFICSPA